MKASNLDLDTIRTLIAAKDLGGYRHAATHLGRTPSAISLQMKRLQEDVGAVLFRRNGRKVALTEAGEIVLHYGRKMLALNDELLDTVHGAYLTGSVSVGFSQDFAETVLPYVLSRFRKLYPFVQIEVLIETNVALVDAVEKGRLDLALAVGEANRATAQILGEIELVWIAGEEFTSQVGQPLPLVLLGPQCSFRKRTIELLDQAGMAWRVAVVSPSVAGLWASAIAGLGVTARSALGLPIELISGRELFGLPRLGSFPITLHSQKSRKNNGIERLHEIIRDAVIQTTSSLSAKQK